MFLIVLRKEEGKEKELFYANQFKMSVNHWSNIPHAQEYFLDTLLFFFLFFSSGKKLSPNSYLISLTT